MTALVREVLQRLQGFPDGEINEDISVKGMFYIRHGQSIIGFQAPDETGRNLGNLINGFQHRDELRYARVGEREAQAGKVDLREVMRHALNVPLNQACVFQNSARFAE